jgi:glutamyl-tRNA reductase
VPGEAQILGQLKRAFRLSREEHAAGGFLASLVDEALHVAKHIHNETGLGEGKVSIASLAMEEIRRNVGDLSHRCVMSIGAGKMNELLLKQLASHRCRLLIANRSEDKARELAEAYGGRYVKFADIRHRMQEADVLVSCTGATEPIITRRCLADCLARRHEGMLLIDLAVPRDIDPAGANLPGVVLKNIDQLEGAARDGIDRRCEHMGKATDLVNEHVRDYLRAQASAEVNPTIEALYRRVEEIIEEETSEAENKFSTHPDAEEDMDILRRSLRRSLRRFCHHAVDTLRAEAAEGSGGPHAALLRKLFKLEDEG